MVLSRALQALGWVLEWWQAPLQVIT
jgi:hypothetical protein